MNFRKSNCGILYKLRARSAREFSILIHKDAWEKTIAPLLTPHAPIISELTKNFLLPEFICAGDAFGFGNCFSVKTHNAWHELSCVLVPISHRRLVLQTLTVLFDALDWWEEPDNPEKQEKQLLVVQSIRHHRNQILGGYELFASLSPALCTFLESTITDTTSKNFVEKPLQNFIREVHNTISNSKTSTHDIRCTYESPKRLTLHVPGNDSKLTTSPETERFAGSLLYANNIDHSTNIVLCLMALAKIYDIYAEHAS